MSAIEFYFDYRSPYSYLALSQLPGLGQPIVFRPMDVLEVMKLVNNVPTTITCEVKGRYARMDLGRWAALYQVPLKPPRMAEVDGRALLRATLAAERSGREPEVVNALYGALWGGGQTLASGDDIAAALHGAGVETGGILSHLADLALDAELTERSRAAAERGVFGAPTFFADGEMFFGNDRIGFLRRHVRQAA